ncbi:MAG TPA: SLC13 family permease [Gemmatimonadaceae bacterium]|nr:SLC13 family permease [Gemmatimonadaceae bacterium]
MWPALVVFALTITGLAIGRIPGLAMDRASIAFVGAVLMLATGALSLTDALSPASIDYETLLLLFSMMVVIGVLRLDGAFDWLSHAALDHITTPRALLATTILLSGVLSAFLVNDIVCVALTPLVLHIALRMRADPIPHLIGLATAANVGSVATITGNPQNMLIGLHSRIPYLVFAAHLLPVALIGLVLTFAIIAFVYRRPLSRSARNVTSVTSTVEAKQASTSEAGTAEASTVEAKQASPLEASTVEAKAEAAPASAFASNAVLDPSFRLPRVLSIVVPIATIVLFCTGLPIPLVAAGAAAVLLVARTDQARIYDEIDWRLLVMFAGLFVVVHAFQLRVVSHWQLAQATALTTASPITGLGLSAAALSNIVSNVPAVLLLEPLVHTVPPTHQQTAWLTLAMASTFAGNLTVIGSVANLIVVERARRDGVHLSFTEYLKAGIPITLLTLALGLAWLTLTS